MTGSDPRHVVMPFCHSVLLKLSTVLCSNVLLQSVIYYWNRVYFWIETRMQSETIYLIYSQNICECIRITNVSTHLKL